MRIESLACAAPLTEKAATRSPSAPTLPFRNLSERQGTRRTLMYTCAHVHATPKHNTSAFKSCTSLSLAGCPERRGPPRLEKNFWPLLGVAERCPERRGAHRLELARACQDNRNTTSPTSRHLARQSCAHPPGLLVCRMRATRLGRLNLPQAAHGWRHVLMTTPRRPA